MSYIIYSIPVFFLLIGVELLIDKLRKTNYYRFNDAITNLSCGIGSQLTGVFLKLTIIAGGYFLIYENESLRLFTFPYHSEEYSTTEVVVTWIVLFIGVDFFYYWFHRLAHEISILWGSHIVHHQSEEYNLTVALRQAWFQGVFSWVFYLPLAFLGFHPLMFITVNSFQTLYQFWIHTKTIDKMPKWFEYVLNTPSHHRVHHGVNPKYIDRNHGGTLIIFDRMFGTFQKEEETVVYGITTPASSWNPLWVNFEYWIDLFKDFFKASKWSDKIKILTNPPGWKPEELGGIQQPKEITPQKFHKYNTDVPIGLSYYVFFQFLFVLAGTTFFLFNMKTMALPAQLGISALVIFSIVNIGGLFERKRWALFAEILRIIIVSFSLIALFFGKEMFLLVLVVSSVLFLISMIWLGRYREIFSVKLA